jgi:pyruvate/2-oxoglutarate dehydrogenase complex dihydrolipoamide dehydrogenase (E3) component
MFNLASYLEDSQHYMEFYGVKAEVKLDFAQFKKNRDAYVHRLNEIYLRMIAKSDITYVEGLAHFKDEKTIAITA